MPYITSIERFGRAEGLEQGREEGLEQGREEGQRDLVRRAVLRRFGTIPPTLEVRIADANPEELTALFDQALVAESLDEI